jgi:hypothetical protein
MPIIIGLVIVIGGIIIALGHVSLLLFVAVTVPVSVGHMWEPTLSTGLAWIVGNATLFGAIGLLAWRASKGAAR